MLLLLITGHDLGVLRLVGVVFAHQCDARGEVELLVGGGDFVDEAEDIHFQARHTVGAFALELGTALLLGEDVIGRGRGGS